VTRSERERDKEREREREREIKNEREREKKKRWEWEREEEERERERERRRERETWSLCPQDFNSCNRPERRQARILLLGILGSMNELYASFKTILSFAISHTWILQM
jgi:hypothetical protein